MSEHKGNGLLTVTYTVWCCECVEWEHTDDMCKNVRAAQKDAQDRLGWKRKKVGGRYLWFCPICKNKTER